MVGFYRKAALKGCATGALVAAVVVAQAVRPALAASEPPPLGSSITVAPLAELPSSADLYSVLDTVIPETIADRIDTGGLSTGEPARIGAHGSSWTQTRFFVGDVDITDPLGTGTPLLMPTTLMWDRVDAMTGLMPIDRNAPGLAIALTPRRGSDRWRRMVSVAGTIPALNAGGPAAVPPEIARLDTWIDGDLVVGGPDVFWTTTATRATRFERSSTEALESDLLSSFAHVGHAIGWIQRATFPPSERTIGGHAQVSWDRHSDRLTTFLFGGITAGDHATDQPRAGTLQLERLRDGPVPDVLTVAPSTSRTWTLGAKISKGALMFGASAQGEHASVDPGFGGTVAETLDGIPAHVWQFTAGSVSTWNSTTLTAFASGRAAVHPRVTVDGGLRAEHVAASNSTGATVVSWNDLMPRGSVRWKMFDFADITAFGGYSRYGHRLPLRDLAWGDPTAPTGRMLLANGTTLVSRLGPGTAGDPTFTSIDPSLKRPHMDEIVTGFEARPTTRSFVRLSAIGRRERDLIGVADVGVPESAYAVSYIFDKGVDLVGAQDDELLPVYNRPTSTFGADRYVLTNPADDEGTFVGADLTYQTQTDHLFLLMGATAGRSEGLSASRGFNATENDNGVLGDVFIDPNARTFAQGRLFTERGYTLKWSGSYHFSHGETIGIIARYQDGQHFARLVIVPDLNQGPEAIRAFRNGRTRFTYTLTIDVRLQKQFGPVAGFVDAFNLLNKAKEVEEFDVTGPTSRLTAAVQPPRAIHLGARIIF